MLLEISVNIDCAIDLEFLEKTFHKLDIESLIKHKEKKEFDDLRVGLVIVSDEQIREANKKYRNKDKVTDVLSFEFMTGEFVLPDKKKYLGEILISYSEAVRQAKQMRISIKKRLTQLFIHGLLHLLGYDHKKEKEIKEMKELEKLFFNKSFCQS